MTFRNGEHSQTVKFTVRGPVAISAMLGVQNKPDTKDDTRTNSIKSQGSPEEGACMHAYAG